MNTNDLRRNKFISVFRLPKTPTMKVFAEYATTIHTEDEGNKNSGNWGHEGRPGQIGGSGGGGGNGSGNKKTTKSKKPVAKKLKHPKLLPKERAALHHELNTHLTEAERSDGVVTKNLFGAYYTVEIHGFDEYNVIRRTKADETRATYLNEFRKKGTKK